MTDLEKSQRNGARASTNLVLMGVLHFLFGFFASLGYAIALKYWKPFWIATLVAIASGIIAIILAGIVGFIVGASGGSRDTAGVVGFFIGIPLGFIPPLVSFLMFRARVLSLRARL